jgi:hypothetical protein
MKRVERIGIKTIATYAILVGFTVVENSLEVGRADPGQAAGPKKPASRKSAKRPPVSAARKAQRLQARQEAIAVADGWVDPGYTSGNGTGNAAGSGATNGSGIGGPALNFGSGITGSAFSSASGASSGSTVANSASASGSGSGAAAAVGAASGTGSPDENGLPATTFNAKILEFAVDHLGMQVGNGECWMLGTEALDYAGAAPPRGNVFGAEIPLSSILPGDILEFTVARFVGANYWMVLGAPNHTAIVDSAQGTTVVLLHQNYNGVKRVQKTAINLADLKSGTVVAYRAVARM